MRYGRYRVTPHASGLFGTVEDGRELLVEPTGALSAERVRKLMAIASPHVVGVVDHGVEERGAGFLVYLPFADQPLHELATPVSPERAGAIALGMARGVAALHAAGLHHGMLTPASFRLAGDDIVLVDVAPAVTETAVFGGMAMFSYLSPERARNAAVDARTDVYAIGAILYWLVSGRRPFEGEGMQALSNILLSPQPMTEDFPMHLASIVRCAMAREPADRYATIAELVAALGATPGRYTSSEAVENELVAALRANPGDRATREVYADWLEQRGDAVRAVFLRTAAGNAGDPAWRTVTSNAPVEGCHRVDFAFACPKRWDALAPTPSDGVRHCGTCNQQVYFCTTVEEANERGGRGQCVAVDTVLVRPPRVPIDVGRHMTMGIVMPPPPPPPPEPRSRGVLARIKGWFQK